MEFYTQIKILIPYEVFIIIRIKKKYEKIELLKNIILNLEF
jgi:hypothetical protein